MDRLSSIFIGVMASVKWETFGESPFETEVSSLKIPEPLKVGCLRRFSFARKVACLANPKLKGSATRLFELLLMMLYFLINYLFLFIICWFISFFIFSCSCYFFNFSYYLLNLSEFTLELWLLHELMIDWDSLERSDNFSSSMVRRFASFLSIGVSTTGVSIS